MIIFMTVIQLLAVYITIHFCLAFASFMPLGWAMLLSALCMLMGQSFLIIFIMEYRFSINIPEYIKELSFFVMVFVFYITLLYLVSDFIRLIGLLPEGMRSFRMMELGILSFIALMVVIFGACNVSNVVLVEQEVRIERPIKDMDIVLVTDLHIGAGAMDVALLEKVVGMVNDINPDLVILGGDIVDNRFQVIFEGGFDGALKNFNARYGVYAIMGNHEYYRNNMKDLVSAYDSLGFKILRDEKVYIKELDAYLVGLDDITKTQIYDVKLEKIGNLMSKDSKAFKIVVSHNPIREDEAVVANSDLFLGGHTHNGQLFPVNLILRFMYRTVHGYAKRGDTHVYVSGGAGVWGPAVRVGGNSEIILLRVRGKNDEN